MTNSTEKKNQLVTDITDIKIDNNKLIGIINVANMDDYEKLRNFMIVNQNISIFKIVDQNVIVLLEKIMYLLLDDDRKHSNLTIIYLQTGLYRYNIILSTHFKYIESERNCCDYIKSYSQRKLSAILMRINKFWNIMAINSKYLSAFYLNANLYQFSCAKRQMFSQDLFEKLKTSSNECCHKFCILMQMVRIF